MATISKSGINPNQLIKSEHLTRIIDAFNGISNVEIIITGSLRTTSSNIVDFKSAEYITGSFKGDGSQLTGIPTGSSGDFVTVDTTQNITGAKIFLGDPIISGSLFLSNTDGVGGNIFLPTINGGRNNNNLRTRLFQHDGKLGYKSPNNVTGSVQFDNDNSDHRTYTFPDKDGTVAMMSDVIAGSSGSSVIDADYGDITVSETGSVWEINGGYVNTSTDQYDIDGEKTFIGAVQLFDGRVGIQTPVFGSSRLGDSEFQAKNIDTTAINFKSGSQSTIAAMFLNPDGTVLTIKGFDDSVLVTNLTSREATSGSEPAESTIANTIEFTNGHVYINDQGVQIYPAASTPVAKTFFQILQNRGGAPRMPFYQAWYDGTTYDDIMTIDTGSSYNFSKPVRGPAATGSSDFVIKSQLDNIQESFISVASNFSIIPADHRAYTVVTSPASVVTVDGSSLTNDGDFTIVDYIGSGSLTIASGSGATLRYNSVRTNTLSQYSVVTIKKIASNEYRLYGELDLA